MTRLKESLKIYLMLWLFLSSSIVHATHIRAGEIIAKQDFAVSLSYTFTVIGYRYTGSDVPFGTGILEFGDGTNITGPFNVITTPVGNDTERVSFSLTHVYDSFNGNGFVISYMEKNRNGGIINMSNSVGTSFYVETLIIIDPIFGNNSSPVMTVPPIDVAAVGFVFTHNPGAYDPNGDSLSYSFTIPKQARNKDVNGYQSLIDSAFYSTFDAGSEEGGTPTLELNPVTGDLVWNAPGDAFTVFNGVVKREYNLAITISEWRNVLGSWFLIGYVVRDMQIIVEETHNARPFIEPLDDRCVIAGQAIQEIVIGRDPDGDPVRLEAFGGPFEIQNPATYTIPENNPGVLVFDWSTVCGHVRERPYEVQFKVTDQPAIGPKLVDFESMEITVVGPAPTGLEAVVQPGKSIRLNWDLYSCTYADKMQIWRKVSASAISIENCETGMPDNAGFRMVGEVDAFLTQFVDQNEGSGLNPGAQYCYRLVATFPFPTGGKSYVSDESCETILEDVPVITNVDVRTTSDSKGEILVKWTPPYEINQENYPPGYTYDLFRAEGQRDRLDATNPENRVKIASRIADTTFLDSGLNTLQNAYTYFLLFYDGRDVVVDTSALASSIRLTTEPVEREIGLSWAGLVPWSMKSESHPFHYIYRDHMLLNEPTQLILIDSARVTEGGFTYFDNGSFKNEELNTETEYCYYVVTYGYYGNPRLPHPLINKTQIACAKPDDFLSPCAPIELTINDSFDCNSFFADKECGFNDFSNTINWTVFEANSCDKDVQYYRIYFSESGLQDDLILIGTSISTQYVHENLSSFKGCYRIQAVDESGSESALSELICADNCPNFLLPNAFSPNGDGINDFFTPLVSNSNTPVPNFDYSQCPRFVKDVSFEVFDRTGNKVYEYLVVENNRDVLINWSGKNQAGLALPAGIYYYEARVTFDVLNPRSSKELFKGWVQLLR